MARAAILVLILGVLPGAILFRLPVFDRDRRAQLGADERLFWAIVLSVVWTLGGVIALALLGEYSLNRVVAVTLAASAVAIVVFRRRLLFGGSATRVSWTVLVPLVLVVLGCWRSLPPSEYIIGGRDPGTYINEGIQIAQRGSLLIHDPVVAAVPPDLKSLFFAASTDPNYESSRFMGFYVLKLDSATIVGQFPHLFPASIAVAYDLFGLTGARMTTPFWAVLGLAAVYFAGARLFGRAAAAAGALLLSLHVIYVWFARYPNSEIAMLALLFAALLAFARAHQDADPFFAPVAALVTVSLLFLRVDALVVIAAMSATAGLAWLCTGMRPRAWWVAIVVTGTIAGVLYLMGPVKAYFGLPVYYFTHQPPWLMATAALAALAAVPVLLFARRRYPAELRTAIPIALSVIVATAAVYAYFLRVPDPIDTSIKVRLADHDAYIFRTFVDFYLFWPATIAAITGFALASRRAFWRDPAFFLLFAAFSLVFFYKIRVVHEHFWMARRFVPLILPGALLLAAAALVGPGAAALRGWRLVRVIAGAAVIVWVGQQYRVSAAPVARHVEFAGIIPYVERLAGHFTARDLVIVEARDAGSDTHVFSVPLAYIYDRNVLVLGSVTPDKNLLRRFLADALSRYERVFFIGGGGTNLLSRQILATAEDDERVRVFEYAHTPWNAYPEGPRRKDFEYSIYRLSLGDATADGFTLDVGYKDDLHTYRFFAKEVTEGRPIRWTGPGSVIAVPGLSGRERELQLEMHNGGRPPTAGAAEVTVSFNDVPLATITVETGFRTYVVPLPADLVARAGAADEPARIRLDCTTWKPRDHGGAADDRNLGVMVDRVTIR